METRSFGRTGLEISRLTFGCGAVGGLMTKGSAADQDNAVAWAREHGINFFDTAASYGNGVSESNLGRALRGKRDGAVVATKVALGEADMADIAGAIHRSLEASLQRLQMDQVDIFQLHNTVSSTAVRGARTSGSTITVAQVLDEVIPALQALRDAGKIRFLGFTANGDVTSLHQLVACGAFDSAQIFYNLLVPSAGQVMPPNYPAVDFRQLLHKAETHGVGSIGVRVLAGGALSGHDGRHPLGMQEVRPIGSDTTYATDVARARLFASVVEAGFANNLAELAVRYAISSPVLSTTEIGIATLSELQQAVAAVAKGPLPAQALALISQIQSGLADD